MVETPIIRPIITPPGLICPLLSDPYLAALYIPSGSSDKLRDFSGKGNHGELVGPLRGMNSVIFDGDDYVSCGNFANLTTPASPMSAFVFFKAGAIGAEQRIISKRGYVDSKNVGWNLLQTNFNKGSLQILGNGITSEVFTTQSIAVGDVVSICGTYDGSENQTGMNIYYNGASKVTGISEVISAGTINPNNITLGRDSKNNNAFLTGSIYMIAIFLRELSAIEVGVLHDIAKGLR